MSKLLALLMHRISVITPSYNQLGWLKLCAASVADQAGVEIEHIIQDAGTGNELVTWAAGQPQIKLTVERDEGMYDAINRGLKRATGQICAYLNCDEQYLPGTLRTVADFFETHPGIDVLFGDAILIDPSGQPLSYRRMVLPNALHTRLAHLGTLSAATFFRRSIVDRNLIFDPKWKAIGDAVWVDQLIQARVPMAVLPQPLAVFAFTGVNLGAQDRSQTEGEQWRKTSPALSQLLKGPVVLHHRFKKLIHGAYSRKTFTARHYTPDSPSKRKRFSTQSVRFGWPNSSFPEPCFVPQTPLDQAAPVRIAAVFSTFNRCSDALTCLDHLAKQTTPLHRIIVVDNASEDGSVERLRKEFGTILPLEVIPARENLGNPAGIQLAMRRALETGATHIWILDDDSWPHPDALANLIRFGLNPQTVYSSLVLDPKKNNLSWPTMVLRCNRPQLAMQLSELPKEEIFEVRGAWLGALVPAEIIQEVGEVNGDLFIRGEDEEYPARIRKHGFHFLCVPGSVLSHPSPSKLLRLSLRGQNYFYEPHLPLWKSYYAVRNQIHVRKSYAQTAFGGYLKGLTTFFLSVFFCLAVDDHKSKRLRIQLKAAYDGLTGRLGKRVLPNKNQ